MGLINILLTLLKKQGKETGLTLPSGNIWTAIGLGGQSNMANRNTSTSPVADGSGYIQGCKILEPGGNFSFVDWRYGYNTGDTDNISNWGLGDVAVKLYRDYTNKTIYCIKTAEGGTSLAANWLANPPTLNAMMVRTKQNIDFAFDRAAKQGKVLKFTAYLWHQGESDYQSPDNTNYKARMIALIALIRGWCRNENLPFIMGTISEASAQYSPVINQSQREIAVEISNVHLVDLSSKTLFDSYHLDDASSYEAGQDYFEVLKTL